MTNSPKAPSTASRAFYTRTVGHSSLLGGGTKVQCSTSRTAQLIVPDTPAPRACAHTRIPGFRACADKAGNRSYLHSTTMTMTMTGHTKPPTTAYSLDMFGQAVRKIKLLAISQTIILAFSGNCGGGVSESTRFVLTVRGEGSSSWDHSHHWHTRLHRALI